MTQQESEDAEQVSRLTWRQSRQRGVCHECKNQNPSDTQSSDLESCMKTESIYRHCEGSVRSRSNWGSLKCSERSRRQKIHRPGAQESGLTWNGHFLRYFNCRCCLWPQSTPAPACLMLTVSSHVGPGWVHGLPASLCTRLLWLAAWLVAVLSNR